MRTTISMDERLGEAAKRRAAEEGLSLSAFIARAVRESLARPRRQPDEEPFVLITAGGSGPHTGIDLDRTSDLLVAEDRERYGR